MTLAAPQPIQSDHDLSMFNSGRAALDDWLRQRARKNEISGASRTYVICEAARVVGYYCLASGSVENMRTPGKIRRNMPHPIPVMLLGRLAVDISRHGEGLGGALLKDAILRTLKAAEISGMRALLVHALDQTAARFYLHNGFVVSPINPLVLLLALDTARQALTSTSQ
ncbi:MAG: GNAT family N-acetyltransferase [Rhodospirillaceae bacterium]|jgi:GNAT superfamily N-acetyltransferase|nr:GNAT family N-acetyltransferase [Rhodospirillaceae bacterium]MBT5674413.1 GNAT family N-acetyltransferase [Rhodospirillaceae bacterium]MBT5778096.1 GNAT family N-acetyltransferase [Rhodospirillaceae bacterium]MBT6829387.1 GNAT family N-acetyltransferase [Rhodospirillaceae bacterium]MBT7292609.1 GNAT family N-acetyltransferase [Rhodospirillaceae bacterium]